jgi:hypothetical protein
VLRASHPLRDLPADATRPPTQLLAFLSHLQVTLEASYISTLSATPNLPSGGLSTPPRTASLNRLKPRPPNLHPSIFPPQTPHPTPYTGDADRRYMKSEGTPLATVVWGENKSEDTRETFSLCWSESEKLWIALYRLSVDVGASHGHSLICSHSSLWCAAFLRMNLMDPLLCLTVSVTLRDKPAESTPARRSLDALISAAGGLPDIRPKSLEPREDAEEESSDELTGLEEINLLEGLSAGMSATHPSFDRLMNAC